MNEEDKTFPGKASRYLSIFGPAMVDEVSEPGEDTPYAVGSPLEKDQQNKILERGDFSLATAVVESSDQECKDTGDSSDYSKWTMILPQPTWDGSQDEQVKPRNGLVRRISHRRSYSSEYYLIMYNDTRDKLRKVQRGIKALLGETLMRERKAFLRAEKSGVRPALIETDIGIEWYSNRELKKAEINCSLRKVRREWRIERRTAKRLRRELITYDIKGQLGKVAQEKKAIGKKRWKDGGRGWLGI